MHLQVEFAKLKNIMKSTINRRKALKLMGLGMLGTCMPQLPAIAKDKKEKKDKKTRD